MKQKRYFAVFILLAMLFGMSLPASAGLLQQIPVHNSAPLVVSYQGYVKLNGSPYNGTGYFKFVVVNAAGDASYWSNDGTSAGGGEPTAAVSLAVTDGLFSVLLGDTALANMSPLAASAFDEPERYLRVWFSDDGSGFDQLSPDRRIAAVPYALQAEEASYAAEAGNADTLDSLHASAFQQHYANVVVVAKSGGDYETITAALDSITTASAANRYLVRVMPGVYSEQVTMKPYVDIEGSGELTTRITYTGSVTFDTGTLLGANNAEVRFLTVENTGGNSVAIAIYNNSAAPRLTQVTASALGSSYNLGVYNNYSSPGMTDVTASAVGGIQSFGFYNNHSSPEMTDVTASTSGGSNSNTGVYNTDSSPSMTGVVASGSGGDYSYGVSNFQSSPLMTHVTASASSGTQSVGVYNKSSSPEMTDVSASASGGTYGYGVRNDTSTPVMRNVNASATGGSNSNFGVYNYQSSSPEMTNVTASASGGIVSYGVNNDTSSSPRMTNITTSASGSSNSSYGVFNSASSPVMTDVTASASGGSNAYAVYNSHSDPIINNSSLRASGGTNNYGVYNYSAVIYYTMKIHNSQVTGSTNTIYNNNYYTTRIGATLLDGGPVTGGGTVTCAGVYDEAYVFYASTCP